MPLASLLAYDAYLQLKMCLAAGPIGNREPKQFESIWPWWFFSLHWNTLVSVIITKFKIFIFVFLQVTVKSSDPLYRGRGVPVNWFQRSYHLWYCTIILHILRMGKWIVLDYRPLYSYRSFVGLYWVSICCFPIRYITPWPPRFSVVVTQ